MIEPWFTAFGYGYLSEIPAAYVLKYLALFGPASELSAGYQDLWERVARHVDVRRNVTVRRVRRDDHGVLVESDSGSVRFDAIVLACPADHALRVLDADEEERDLLSRVRWQDYRVVVASVRRFCDARQLFFPKHFGTSTRGEPMCAYRRWPDSDVRLFYAFGDGASLDDTAERAVAMVRAAGGEVTKVHRTVGWRYFPHVTPADMASGFYGRLEALQGALRTFYAGELLSFGTVENVVAYSDALVERYFDARRKPAAESRASAP
jgi:predicted NAD/FAD-binding protein